LILGNGNEFGLDFLVKYSKVNNIIKISNIRIDDEFMIPVIRVDRQLIIDKNNKFLIIILNLTMTKELE
jgi:hypothetical protein